MKVRSFLPKAGYGHITDQISGLYKILSENNVTIYLNQDTKEVFRQIDHIETTTFTRFVMGEDQEQWLLGLVEENDCSRVGPNFEVYFAGENKHSAIRFLADKICAERIKKSSFKSLIRDHLEKLF